MAEYEFDFDSTTLSVTLEADSAVTGATLALPYIFRGGAVSSATVDGESVEVCPQQLEGREQVLLSADYSAGESRRWRVKWGTW